MIIKTNLHFHTKDDPLDHLPYTPEQAIDQASKLGFEAIAFTYHTQFYDKKKHQEYASKKNILLISGTEANIEGKDIVVLNCDKKIEEIKSMAELRNYKKQNPQILIIAPHPFVLSKKSLGKKLIENIDLFDAIELSIFSNSFFGFNKKAQKIAKKYSKPLIATSDTHNLNDLEKGYTLIDAENKKIENIFSSIKKNKLQNKIEPMNIRTMAKYRILGLIRILKKQKSI
ncbi:MAG: PHP domain-containing protein [Candidatus Marinimicrobia bacterium]|nr:PHP domain-containing protein [Candidatus Neomarinimicrobiota bacterium]